MDFDLLNSAEEARIVKQAAQFGEIIAKSAESCKPHVLAHYLIELCQAFNEFYHAHQVIIGDKERMKARLLLVDCVRQVLENGLELLGIKAPEEM